MFQASVHPVVWVSSILGLIVSPLAAMQQHKLTQVEALSQTNERLEAEVSQLVVQNTRLSTTLQQSEESVYNLQTMQETLETLQSVQGQSIGELEDQLQESRKILAMLHSNYKGELLQNIISIVLGSDDNQDMILSDDDIDILIHRLEGINNVQIDEDALRKLIIDHGRCVEALMEVAKSVLSADQKGNKIFSLIKPEEGKEEDGDAPKATTEEESKEELKHDDV